MTPRIELLQEKKLIGHHMTMSLIHNRTSQLWGGFAPRIKSIENRVSIDKFSLQIYPLSYFEYFDPNTEFVKWATVEVEDHDSIPKGLNKLILKGGLYAVFDYKGSSSDRSIFEYIFSKWLPNSDYRLDNRPHFEVLGVNYKNNDLNSEEEIWIPIRTN